MLFSLNPAIFSKFVPTLIVAICCYCGVSLGTELNPPSEKGRLTAFTSLGTTSYGAFSGRGVTLGGGYFYSERIFIEGSYSEVFAMDGGVTESDVALNWENVLSTAVVHEANFTTLNAGVRIHFAYYPSSFHLYFRGGFASWTFAQVNSYDIKIKTSETVDNSAAAEAEMITDYPDLSSSGMDMYIGLGGDYFITESMFIGLDYTSIQGSPDQIVSLNATFGYLF
ncbi:MAG: outer membrane beta-barrel protein [Gammaproteobacteria bacterium]|nr:outer membrane beta-barrel protein [Gammaproteobacteria bacterium]